MSDKKEEQHKEEDVDTVVAAPPRTARPRKKSQDKKD